MWLNLKTSVAIGGYPKNPGRQRLFYKSLFRCLSVSDAGANPQTSGANPKTLGAIGGRRVIQTLVQVVERSKCELFYEVPVPTAMGVNPKTSAAEGGFTKKFRCLSIPDASLSIRCQS